MRNIILICLVFWLCGVSGRAESFQLMDGRTVTGEVLDANDLGLQVRVGDGQYERIPWGNFSQEDLKKFNQSPKLSPLVDPFIETTQEERVKKTEVTINAVPRLNRPPPGSLPGAVLSSELGVLIILLLYAANLYAGFEVALFRARPIAVVCGAAAVLPVIGPIIFLCLPTVLGAAEELPPEAAHAPAGTVAAAEAAAAAAATDSSPLAPDADHAASNPGGLHLAVAEPAPAENALPETQIFQRGAYTFNRRFLETKFAGFFGVIRRDAEKDMILLIKTARGEYHGTRISRISANDLHLQVVKGNASEDILIPFTEIKEIQLKHKDAK